jgi:glutathione gamma-glutamylcysteinyltransferase
MSETTLYRKELPKNLIQFNSSYGKEIFKEALIEGTMQCFFPLIEQFHTQNDPAYCGLGTLIMILNSLNVDRIIFIHKISKKNMERNLEVV